MADTHTRMVMDKILTALEQTNIPIHMWAGLAHYIAEGRPTGGFLNAVLCNDLKRACNLADGDNQKVLYDYVVFLTNNAPAACWGSPERVKNWMEIAKQVQELR